MCGSNNYKNKIIIIMTIITSGRKSIPAALKRVYKFIEIFEGVEPSEPSGGGALATQTIKSTERKWGEFDLHVCDHGIPKLVG